MYLFYYHHRVCVQGALTRVLPRALFDCAALEQACVLRGRASSHSPRCLRPHADTVICVGAP